MGGAYLNIIKGDTYVFQSNMAVDGSASNLDGCDLWFLAKADPADDDADALINVSSDGGGISVSNGANSNTNSVVSVTLNAAYTSNLAAANVLFWTLRADTAANTTYTLDRGRACVADQGS